MAPIKSLFLAALLSASCASAQSFSAPPLHIQQPWSRELPVNSPTAPVYFIIHNGGAEADQLQAVDTPVAGRAELHQHLQADGLMKMQHLDRVLIPAGAEVDFVPAGYHVMLFDLKQALRSGQSFPLTLHFQRAGDVTVEVRVQRDAPTGDPAGPDAANSHHHH